jgi:TonB-linked SusC/RagA family outer membrane protein
MTKKTKMLFLSLVAFLCVAAAQGQTITGKVTDDSTHSPLVSATVSIKGGRVSVSTDASGAFSIPAQGKVTLVVSSIGFRTREISAQPGGTPLAITLPADTRVLGEVVVTALGIARQSKTLVYATQTVPVSQLTEARDPNNVMNSLQGKVANLEITQGSGGPGSGSRFVLRGNKSIQGDNNALIVVDGVPLNNFTVNYTGGPIGPSSTNGITGNGSASNDFGSVQGSDGASNLNPDDIESMNVLRGAAAAALYGPQAQNGVIVITTKKGRAGTSSVSVNSGVDVQRAFALPDFQNSYGQGNEGVLGDSVGASWGAKMTGQSYTNYFGKPDTYSAQPNNVKDFFRTGVGLNNSVAFSSGSTGAMTYVSYTNNYIQGIVPKNDLLRHTVTVRESNQIGKKFSTDARITYISQKINNQPRTGEENAPVIDVYQTPRNISKSLSQQSEAFDALGIPYPTFWASTNSGIYMNPYWMINRTAINSNRDRLLANLTAKWQITPWLSIKGDANLDKSFDRIETIRSQGTILWATQAGGFYEKTNAVNTQKWFDAILEGTNNLSTDLKLNYHVGAIYQDLSQDYTFNAADGLTVPNKFSINYASNPQMTNSYVETQTQAIFGQANLSWKDAIFIDGSYRNDWASPLPKPYTFHYPSIGASVILSNLMTLPQSISFLKASANWAQVGNSGQAQILTSTYNYNTGSGNGLVSRSQIFPLPNLKPELTRSLEFGIDMKFINDRYGFTVNYYNSHSRNQLMAIPLPVASGYSLRYINAGDIRNRGLEVVLNAGIVKSHEFTWDLAANFSLNRNKIISLDPNLKSIPLGGGFGRSATPYVKQDSSYGDLYANKWQRDAQGRFVVDANGKPVPTADQQYIGNFNPSYLVGLTNTFTYKRFNLRVLVDGRLGGIIVSGTEMNLAFSGITKATEKYREGGWVLNAVDATGHQNTKAISAQDFWQSASYQRYGNAEFFAYSASALRLRELTLGYEIPLPSSQHVIKSAHLNLVARNLFWIYRGSSILDIPGLGKRKMWMDPDMSLGSANYQGIEYGALPSTRSLGFNLRVNF